MNTTTIKVSVIVPVYNVEEYLRECLDSICNQTLREIEIICIDDGSTDRSREILEEYRSRDERIRVIFQENSGQGAARNRGLEIATGKYIYFLDSDDKIVPYALEKLETIAEQDKLEIIFFDADSFYETSDLENKFPQFKTNYHSPCAFPEIYTGDKLLILSEKNKTFRVNTPLEFFEREFLNKNFIYFREGVFHEDDIFTFQVLSFARRVRRLRERLYIRRVRENSTMTQGKTLQHFKGYYFCAQEIDKILMLRNHLPANIRASYKTFSKRYTKFYENLFSELSPRDQELAVEFLQKLSPTQSFLLPKFLTKFFSYFIFNHAAREHFLFRYKIFSNQY